MTYTLKTKLEPTLTEKQMFMSKYHMNTVSVEISLFLLTRTKQAAESEPAGSQAKHRLVVGSRGRSRSRSSTG